MELRPGTLAKAGLWSAGLGWAPIVVIGLIDPTTHPTGLAIVAWAGTMLGLGLVAAALALALARRVERRRRRAPRASINPGRRPG
jgi:hypothetical protein